MQSALNKVKQFSCFNYNGTLLLYKVELTRKYTSRQKISAAKKKDLVSLCRSGIIPSEEDSDQE
jgi:hypothetical protein